MREIPAEVRDLLKSRSMIGENKPSHEVTVEGLSGGYDWDKSNTIYQPIINTTDYHPSCVKLSDGRILYMYSRGSEPGAIYQAFAPDLNTFVTQDNSVVGEEVVLTNLYYPRATVFKTPSGELFFIVTYKKTTTEQIARTLLYKSALGDGSDWAYYSAIQEFDWTDFGDWGTGISGSVGLPFLINNRWILMCQYYDQVFDKIRGEVGMYYSDDNGLTWTKSFSKLSYASGTDIPDPRNIVYFKNALWWLFKNAWYGGTYQLLKSTDYGSTWTEVFNKALYVPSVALIADEDNLYMFNGGNTQYDRGLFATNIEPTKLEDFVKISERVNPWDNTIVVKIDDKLVMTGGTDGCGVLGLDVVKKNIPVKSISISRNKNMAGSLNLSVDNKKGEWSPDNTVNQNVLFPNKEITVKQGYGTELVQTFSGLIDRIEMTTFPQEINLSVRDKLKLALDQIITPNVITYTGQTVEAIFTDLATKAGLTTGTIETTGLTLTEKTFSWETYADCFSWLADLVGFEFGCDEDGKVYFKKEAIPTATDWILTFADGTAQAYFPIVSGSDVLKSSDGSTTYIRDTDYMIDYDTGELTSITIPDGETLMSYVFAAYSFKEGEDIISLGYTIDDNDIYSKVVVYGKDTNDEIISAYKDYVSKDYYNVLNQKIMKIDVSEASTVEQLQAIADRAEMLMRSRVREVSFVAIAVPWLQVGDLIQVVESSTTISEIYRVTDLSTAMDNNGYTMQITCYHHSA